MKFTDYHESAREHARKMKNVSPEIFPEYAALKLAEQNLDKAKDEYDAALLKWKTLYEGWDG